MLYNLLDQKESSGIKPWHALAALIVTNILIAIFIGRNFGEGWDETLYYLYGERSLDAYMRGLAGLQLIPSKHIFFFNLRYYGPFYAAIGKFTVDMLLHIFKNWSYADTWHLVNFGFFQVGLVNLYLVAKRFISNWSAFSVVLLLATQPLLFGHAFINPKDIPFMSFFLASMAAGFMMVEAGVKKFVEDPPPDKNQPSPGHQYRSGMALLFGLYIFTIVGKDIIASTIKNVVSYIYYASPETLFGRLFSLFANQSSRLPVESYIHKAVNSKLDQISLVTLLLIFIAKWIFDEYKWKQKNGGISTGSFRIDLSFALKTLIAGIVLGLTISIRLLAPFAGLLILAYALLAIGKKSPPMLVYYFSIAALTTYLTWPFLWDSPAYRFFEALNVMKAFPFGGVVKFMGVNYPPNGLPWSYVPILMSIQMTEPVVILFAVGVIIAIWNLIKNPKDNKKLFILFAWFLIPVGLFILLHSSSYDNSRQFFFLLPAIFILAGMALELIYKRINHNMTSFMLLVLITIPGLIGITSLHPYEYIYYNSFVGGTTVAANNFETDYWLTSYRDAVFYLNANAPMNTKILAFGNTFNVDHNARKDLRIFGFDSETAAQGDYDYAVISTRYGANLSIFPGAEVVYEVRKNGVLLAVVKKLPK